MKLSELMQALADGWIIAGDPTYLGLYDLLRWNRHTFQPYHLETAKNYALNKAHCTGKSARRVGRFSAVVAAHEAHIYAYYALRRALREGVEA